MTAPSGYYDQSYPPELWETPADPVPVQAARRAQGADTGTGATVSRTLTVAPGTPGTYDPPVPGAERPRNVTELREQARVTSPAPWAAGEHVLIGVKGKVAHWSGEDWRLGASPGYPMPWEQPATVGEHDEQQAIVECAVEGCGVIETGTITEHPHTSPAAADDGSPAATGDA